MKKITLLLSMAASAVLLAGGCAKQEGPAEAAGTTLRATLLPVSKTAIDGVKVTWTAGDAINVNGAVSHALAGASETATFSFRTVIEHPYKAVFPASLYKDASTVTLPTSWEADSFGTPLGGYAESGSEIGFSVLTALVRLTLTGDASTTLKTITVTGGNGEQLGGDFRIDFPALSLTAAGGKEADKTLKVTVGKALSAAPLVVYIPLPAGEYTAGYTVEMADTEGNLMRKEVSARTLKAGELREMPALVFEPNVTPGPEEGLGGIPDAKELQAFAEAVNDGRSTARWQNAEGKVVLLSDIDCSSISDWTPIGVCTLGSADGDWAHNKMTVGGTPFTGKFDGQGYRIKNLHMSFVPQEGLHAWGLFGGIGAGAEVKNLIIDASSSMHISTGRNGVFGVVAGLVADGTVENVSNFAPVTGGGTSSLGNNNAAGRVAVGGVIGWVMACEGNVTTSNLYNAGDFGTPDADFSRGGNAGTGANGFLVGGVIGFSSNTGNSLTQTHSLLKNDGVLYSNAGRVSGIVSSANRYTVLKDAENNGDIHHSASGAFRIGLITCIASEGCALENCVNRGDLIAPSCASAAGVVCLINHATARITGCRSLGATIVCTGIDTAKGQVTYAGALYGQCNVNASFSGCSVSGKVGKSTDDLLTLTADNYFPYVGQAYTGNTTLTGDNIAFAE